MRYYVRGGELAPDNNGRRAMAHIEQSWRSRDAEVGIPFPPYRVAPVSGIGQGLVLRMLHDAIADRLEN